MSLSINFSYEKEFTDIITQFHNTEVGLKLLKIEGISPEQLDKCLTSKLYFEEDVTSMTVDSNANSNENKSPLNYKSEIENSFSKLNGYYLLWKHACKLYGLETATDLINNILNGTVYLHDSSALDIPYCFAATMSSLIHEGRNWGSLKSSKPLHLHSFMGQVIETTIDMSQQQVGALALGDLLACMTYYVKKDKLSDEDIIAEFQTFIHMMNNAFRSSGQSPFTNISLFDRPCFEHLFKNMIFPDGSSPDWKTYNRIQKLYGEFFSKGDPISNLPYRFPVTTVNIFVDENTNLPVDLETFKWFSAINLNKGCFNFYLTSNSAKLASCCRLVNDFEELSKGRSDPSFGNGGLNIGSARVCTINFPKISYRVLNKIGNNYTNDEFFNSYIKELDNVLELTRKILLSQRSLLKDRISRKYLNFFNIGWINLDNMLFSTFGFIGIYDSLAVLKKDPISPDLLEMTKKIMIHVRDWIREAMKVDKTPYNGESIPGESAAIKLAQKDALIFNTKTKIYSNQYVPLTRDVDIFTRMRIDGMLDEYSTGGSISHINIGEKLKSSDQMEKICLYAIKCKLHHFAINYDFCLCQNNHVTIGTPTTKYCNICGSEINNHLTRIIGYFVPISSWSPDRKEDFYNREFTKTLTIDTLNE